MIERELERAERYRKKSNSNLAISLRWCEEQCRDCLTCAEHDAALAEAADRLERYARSGEEWFAAKELMHLSKSELIELYHIAKINELRLLNKLRKAEQIRK